MSPSSSPQRPAKSGAAEKKYKGVRLRKLGKWVSEIRLPNSRDRIWLGSYDTPEKAARAFDAAFVCLRGAAAAGINFPDSPPASLRRRSCDPQVVQAAALSHANRGSPATAHDAPAAEALMGVDLNTNEGVDDGAAAPAPEQADGSMIEWPWSPMAMVASPQPLFSPTGFGSNAYGCFHVPPATVTADAAEDDVEESTSLWDFHARESNFWLM